MSSHGHGQRERESGKQKKHKENRSQVDMSIIESENGKKINEMRGQEKNKAKKE